jgi:serine/threonine-protein kinase HipA
VNRCPITYEECGGDRYSAKGLRLLSPHLRELKDFPFDAAEQRREALIRAGKMSIQGLQPKLSVTLGPSKGIFEITERMGQYIIKPQHHDWLELPENEGLTMHLADVAGINVPVNGLVRCKDGTWSYFVKRFDRFGRGQKLALEDFAQLAGKNRDTKYEFSLEKLIRLLDKYCTFPKIERITLFRMVLFSFLVGNEDLHLKNFSLITKEGKTTLSPAYDLLSSTVALLQLGKQIGEIEESALTLGGKKKKLTRKNVIDYFGRQRLELPNKIIDDVIADFSRALPAWKELIGISFLSDEARELYQNLLTERVERLQLGQ